MSETSPCLRLSSPRVHDGEYDGSDYLYKPMMESGALAQCHGHVAPRETVIGAML